MKKPGIPIDENQRLKTLRSLNILDTPPEERFDRLTRMAKLMFGVPIALVNIVDENRQWFKSRIGLSVNETPRDVSFCGHAILGDEVFIIPDATRDDRFADNPLVTDDPYIRFYAGCPLRFVDGSKLGTLCILDKKPRQFSVEDLEALKDLALTTEHELAAVYLATQDELTNTINRRGFMMLANHSINLCVRQKVPASLAFIDLNRFKLINDEFGHAEGDRVLTIFANQIKDICRESDLFARLGGDEFVIFFSNTTKIAAEEIFVRLRQSLDKYNQASDRAYNILFSYGIVDYDPDKHVTVDALLQDGDALMYEWKKKRDSEAGKRA
ncbi:MAG: sensor domain-containing diguanylate cyclase [Betaproteobacteria bacterium]|nr:sensor domain-containing diguanylate cyclase [Betaproteobacteria bacterium]